MLFCRPTAAVVVLGAVHRSHLPPVRSTAAAALLQFLLDYPLSPSRLQSHMLFLLSNTSYEHEEGRLQALEMLQQVCALCYVWVLCV